MKENNIGSRIKSARMQRGITLRELGDMIGKSYATIYRYESGEIKSLDNVIIGQIAEALDVPPQYLMGWTDISIAKQTVSIPILGTIACGNPITAVENVDSYKERSRDGLPNGSLFYLRCKGDSMSPKIPNGSLVLCKEQYDVETGEIAVVLINGDEEATLKKVRKFNGTVLLEPINPEYAPILVDEKNPARIVGKAVEVSYGL